MAGVRPYRRFLVSVFHRRFVHACLFTLLLCYVEGILLGPKSSVIWSWFPIGPAGFSALMLFITTLPIFMIRIDQMQVGARHITSWTTSFRDIVLKLHSWRMLFLYMFSAWWFGEWYIFQASESADLTWVFEEQSGHRHRLNERPIWLRSAYFVIALFQVAWHITYAHDNIILPTSPPSLKDTDRRTHKLKPIPDQIKEIAPKLLVQSAIKAGSAIVVSIVPYTFIYRGWTWSAHMFFAKLFYNIPRSNANPIGFPPSNPSLIMRTFATGFCLTLLWDATSFLFSIFIAQEPLKKGIPLSTDSKDPNGTLLSGLKTKKNLIKTFAFWELSLISQNFSERRKAIFTDIDRADQPTWTQMHQISISSIKAIEARIQLARTPSPKVSDIAKQDPKIGSLPRLAPEVGPAQKVLASASPKSSWTEKAKAFADDTVRDLGKAQPWTPSAKQGVKGLIEYPSNKIEQWKAASDRLTPWWLPVLAKPYVFEFLRSFLGRSFQKRFPSVLSSIILSSPAETAVIVDATEATTRMLVASLSEDLYGKVHTTVLATVQTFTSTIIAIESLIDTLPPHWTDLSFAIEGANVPSDVETVLQCLKSGLEEILGAFQLYLKEVGVKDSDLKAARDAIKPKTRRKGQPARSVSSSSSSNNNTRRVLEERDRRRDREFLTTPTPLRQTEMAQIVESP